jgi:hypothetical protein
MLIYQCVKQWKQMPSSNVGKLKLLTHHLLMGSSALKMYMGKNAKYVQFALIV